MKYSLRIRRATCRGDEHSLTKPYQSATFSVFLSLYGIVVHAPLPVATLAVTARGKEPSELSEPVYGGYANPRGEIFLFARDGIAYRVNFKKQTLQRRPSLNPGAQARYDATEAGQIFDFGNRSFRRLSHEEIVAICAAHRFRIINISG
ncbi:MAG: hypothetical protein JO113_08945 [Candidatus Eremiobacteraeota bacterium]|nr:hypothetical protein [Candidatus Eremiobacteraeota bacterium]